MYIIKKERETTAGSTDSPMRESTDVSNLAFSVDSAQSSVEFQEKMQELSSTIVD